MLNLKRVVTLSGVLLGVLSFGVMTAGGATAKARSYELSLNTATKVGTQTLAAGDYKVKLEGSNAIFMKQSNNRSGAATFTTTASLEDGNVKFDHTTIHSVQDGGQPRIVSIELEGSKALMKFN